MAVRFSRLSQSGVITFRRRALANALSIALVIRKYSQSARGNAWDASRSSQSADGHSTTRGLRCRLRSGSS